MEVIASTFPVRELPSSRETGKILNYFPRQSVHRLAFRVPHGLCLGIRLQWNTTRCLTRAQVRGAGCLYPHVPGELFREDFAMLRQYARPKVRPVGGGADAFAVGRAEAEEDRDLAVADGGMLF